MARSNSTGTLYFLAAVSNFAFREESVCARTLPPAVPSRVAPASPAPPNLRKSRRFIVVNRFSEYISPSLFAFLGAKVFRRPCSWCLGSTPRVSRLASEPTFPFVRPNPTSASPKVEAQRLPSRESLVSTAAIIGQDRRDITDLSVDLAGRVATP